MQIVVDAVVKGVRAAGVDVAEVAVYYPGTQRHGSWAVYCPTAAEVTAADGWWCTAEKATSNVGDLEGDLYATAADAWVSVDAAWARHGALLVAGFSNGCIVATEYATLHPDRCVGLLLFSGLPAAVQMRWVEQEVKHLPRSVVMTLGSWEVYFGGEASFMRTAAVLGAVLIRFEGGHCKEDPVVVELAANAVLRQW